MMAHAQAAAAQRMQERMRAVVITVGVLGAVLLMALMVLTLMVGLGASIRANPSLARAMFVLSGVAAVFLLLEAIFAISLFAVCMVRHGAPETSAMPWRRRRILDGVSSTCASILAAVLRPPQLAPQPPDRQEVSEIAIDP
mmetsp:Transcript_3973/g.7701  ORF Transcript_3973/g.7701 Transcript_3973/m.7701 type:complete len:141 (+) Transcript_3973:274-696(+)